MKVFEMSMAALLMLLSFKTPAITFDLRDSALRNIVVFSSNATTQKIVAVNNILYGKADLDPNNLSKDIKIYLEYDTRTFETGLIGLNQFLKEHIFSSSTYPTIKLESESIISTSKNKLTKNAVKIVTDTKINFKGIIKTEKIMYLVTLLKLEQNRDLLKIQSNFEIDLSKYGVSIDPTWKNQISNIISFELTAIGFIHEQQLNSL